MGIRGFKARVERECGISRGGRWTRLNNGSIQAEGILGGGHRVGRCGISKRSRDAAGRAVPGVRAA